MQRDTRRFVIGLVFLFLVCHGEALDLLSPRGKNRPRLPIGAAVPIAPKATPSKSNTLNICKSVPSISAISGLKTLKLNKEINTGYAQFAICFQAIVEGNPSALNDLGKALPAWYAFAPYASRVVGRSEAALLEVIPKIPNTLDLLNPFTGPEKVADFMVGVIKGMLQAQGYGNIGVMKDTAVLKATALKAAKAWFSTSNPGGFSPTDRMKAIPQTLLNLLEEGNRLIYSDIGASGATYLKWRFASTSTVTATKVLDEFSSKLSGGKPSDARKVYYTALSIINKSPSSPLPFHFGGMFPGIHSNNFVAAAFALYEQAGDTPFSDLRKKNLLVKFANNLLAYREQHDAAQPAFTPGHIKSGETSREEVMGILTATVALVFRGSTWTFYDYCKAKGADITLKNWGNFQHRWAPIIAAFDAAYTRNPGDLWPMPNPDPKMNP